MASAAGAATRSTCARTETQTLPQSTRGRRDAEIVPSSGDASPDSLAAWGVPKGSGGWKGFLMITDVFFKR